MTNTLQKRLSKLLLAPLKNRKSRRGAFPHVSDNSHLDNNNNSNRTLTIVCTPEHTTESLVSQLQNVHQNNNNNNNNHNGNVTRIVLQEMIQRSDNVQLFQALQDLLQHGACHGVRSIHLLEPHISSADYRRWCYKKTNFLARVRREARQRGIEVTIHGTLILDACLPTMTSTASTTTSAASTTPSNDNATCNSHACSYPVSQQSPELQQQQPQNVSTYLSLLAQLPADPDITSLWISFQDQPFVAPTSMTMCRSSQTVGHGSNDGNDNNNNDDDDPRQRRVSNLERSQSPVQQVFQALIELFNADSRPWHFVHVHVQYHHPPPTASSSANRHPVESELLALHEDQTQSLLEVAELFQIPLQVQWQPIVLVDDNSVSNDNHNHERSFPLTMTRSTSFVPAYMRADSHRNLTRKRKEDDETSTTADMEGSSGAFLGC